MKLRLNAVLLSSTIDKPTAINKEPEEKDHPEEEDHLNSDEEDLENVLSSLPTIHEGNVSTSKKNNHNPHRKRGVHVGDPSNNKKKSDTTVFPQKRKMENTMSEHSRKKKPRQTER
eukprot:TRINITY_DN346_c0_g2_i1.p1 TRINITY_DN346_c0_g2~~TRINITY_DN346_c0_g2_i1.p1  ORF type:complete len:116 (+),score=25.81 TRINITY_DN346_c0_g2_i1:123-470(+)